MQQEKLSSAIPCVLDKTFTELKRNTETNNEVKLDLIIP